MHARVPAGDSYVAETTRRVFVTMVHERVRIEESPVTVWRNSLAGEFIDRMRQAGMVATVVK